MNQTENTITNAFVKTWFHSVAKRDVETIMSLLHPQLTLATPFERDLICGRADVFDTFRLFVQCVEDFAYENVMVDGLIAAINFTGTIAGEHLQGADFFHLNEQGQVIKIAVFARPFTAINALREALQNRLLANG